MQQILLLYLILVSIVFISKGSDWLTDSLIPIARKLKTTNISIGLILISVVISLPEILVALYTSLKGYQEISLGVAFGSIICNIGLMTGLSAIIRPLRVTRTMILRDGIFSVVVPILVFAIANKGSLNRLDGLALFLLFIPYLINVYLQEKGIARDEYEEEKRDVAVELDLIGFGFGKIKAGWISFLLGTGLLLSGTWIFSFQLTRIVEIFNISALFVGLTLGAIVPSIPNIASAYKATKRGLTEVAVSETIGSNIFTLLVTVGIISMVAPLQINRQWIAFDLPVLMLMSTILLIFASTHRSINRKEGVILLGSYIIILVVQSLFLI